MGKLIVVLSLASAIAFVGWGKGVVVAELQQHRACVIGYTVDGWTQHEAMSLCAQ